MKRAAIIIYGDNSSKIMFWILGKPYEIGKINIELGVEAHEIFILEAPPAKGNKYKIKQRGIIEKFCGENNIQSVFYIDDRDEQQECIWSSIKVLCILREIGIIIGDNILNKSFGIVANTLNPILLEAIAEEASSIIILKAGLDEHAMEELYKKIMKEKGLSIAFVSDIKFLISQSKIVIWENSAPPLPFISIERVLLFSQQMDYLQPNEIHMKYREEIAKVIIKLAQNMNIWELASCFPFVYFLKEQGNIMKKEQICLFLARNNKTLTIQKC